MVWNRALPLSVVDSNIMAINHPFFPELISLLTLGEPRQLRWATDPHNHYLRRGYFPTGLGAKRPAPVFRGLSSIITVIWKRLIMLMWQGTVGESRSDCPSTDPCSRSRLNRYTSLDWKLHRCVGVSRVSLESQGEELYGGAGHDDVDTRETAASLGVDNRMDVEASVLAGARYLAQLHRQIGDGVGRAGPHLVGSGSLQYRLWSCAGCQSPRAVGWGKRENTWHGVRSVLPLLQQKKYYSTLEHRYARGQEAVIFVDRIRTYYRILQPVLDARGCR